MDFNVILPEKQYPPKTRTLKAVSIPLGATKIAIRATRVNWEDTGEEIVFGKLDLSLDGGQSWKNRWIGFGARGGVVSDPVTGNVKDYSQVWREIPEPENPNRMVRGEIINTVSFRSAVSIGTE